MASDSDPDTLKDAANGVSECLKNAGPGVCTGQEAMQVVQQLFKLMDESFARSSELETEKAKGAVGTPQELQADEDDEDTPEESENDCRKSLEDAVGAVMKVAPAEFLQCLPECSNRM